jgi:hypothetical protein
MHSTEKITVARQVMARKVGDELVILDPASGTYFGLDPVGARIWELIALGKTLSEICGTMTQEYEVDALEFERDLLALIANLQSQGLIEPA